MAGSGKRERRRKDSGPTLYADGRWFAAVAGALLTGCLLILSYPPFDAAWLAWFALAPLLLVWRVHQRRAVLVLATMVAGAVWGGAIFYPLLFVEGGSLAERLVGFFLTAGAISAFLTVFACGYALIVARFRGMLPAIVAAPALWIAMEFALRLIAAGFSVYLGVTQWSVPAVRAAASVGGIHAVAGVVVAANALVSWAAQVLFARNQALSRGARRSLLYARPAGVALVVVGALAVGLYVLVPGSGWQAVEGRKERVDAAAVFGVDEPAEGERAQVEALTAILVQPGFTPPDYSDAWGSFAGQSDLLDRIVEQTEEALRSREPLSTAANPHLVIWPETTLHIPVMPYDGLRERIETMTREHDVFLLAGFPRAFFEPPPPAGDPGPSGGSGEPGDQNAAADQRGHNTAYLFAPTGGGRAVYDKVYVIPIAESHYARGSAVLPFQIETPGGFLTLGVGICSDAIEPRHALAAVRSGAVGLHYLASLSRIGNLAELERAFLIFRAVEHGVYVTQTATTGPTLVVDPDGNVVDAIPEWSPGVLAASIPLENGGTVYTRYGDWPVGLSGAALLVMGLGLALRGSGRRFN